MIRINLLGQAKPKASRRPVDTGSALPLVFVLAGLAFGVVILALLYYSWQRQLNDENARIKQLQAQKTDLEQVKQQVEAFEKQKQVLQQRVSTSCSAIAPAVRNCWIRSRARWRGPKIFG
jgi:uncharacterized protein HemX